MKSIVKDITLETLGFKNLLQIGSVHDRCQIYLFKIINDTEEYYTSNCMNFKRQIHWWTQNHSYGHNSWSQERPPCIRNDLSGTLLIPYFLGKDKSVVYQIVHFLSRQVQQLDQFQLTCSSSMDQEDSRSSSIRNISDPFVLVKIKCCISNCKFLGYNQIGYVLNNHDICLIFLLFRRIQSFNFSLRTHNHAILLLVLSYNSFNLQTIDIDSSDI